MPVAGGLSGVGIGDGTDTEATSTGSLIAIAKRIRTLLGGTGSVRITDGVNTATVDVGAPAVAAAGLDVREVLSNRKATGTLAALNDALAISCEGVGSVVWEVDGGTLVGTLAFEATIDDSTWFAIGGMQFGGGGNLSTVTTLSKASGTARRGLFVDATIGFSQVRIRVSVYTSGTSAARLAASTAMSHVAALLADTNSQTVAIAANSLILARMQKTTDVSTWANARMPNIFKALNAVAVGVAATIWTPAAGKKFRLMGYHLSGSVAGNYLLNDGAGGTLIDVAPLAATAPGMFVSLGDFGIASAVSDNILECAGPANPSALSGIVFGTEE